MRPAMTLLVAAMPLICCAAAQRGENLLDNPGFEQAEQERAANWGAHREGYRLAPGEGRHGTTAIVCESDTLEGNYGAMQEIVFDPPIEHPFKVSGYSKSEDAAGADYCLWMDCWYNDGTNLWGKRKSFSPGTHDWELCQYTFAPAKPIEKIQFFILFRGCVGKAWFDDVSLSVAPFEVESVKATAGLYGGNSIDYSARLSLAATWTVSVLRDGEEVYSEAGSGLGVPLAWGGRDRAGRLLPGGEYVVRLAARDDLRSEELLRDTPVTTRSGPGKGYVAWVVDSMTRCLIGDMPAGDEAPPTAEIALAGEEYESFQVAIRAAPGQDSPEWTVETSALSDGLGHSIPAEEVQWQQVGFVYLDRLWEHPLMADATPGWWPDPLLPVSRFTIEGGTTQALWFTVHAPAGTPAGTYTGSVTLSPAGGEPLEVAVRATVYGFDLPVQPHIKTAFALMDGYLEKVYGSAPPELRRAYGDYLLKRRLNPDDISRTDPPDIDDIEYYDGRGLNAFNVINMVEPRGNRTWVCWSPLEVYTPDFKTSLIKRLDPYIAELKARNLADKAYVYTFDERGQDFWPVMTEYFGLIKERYGIPTLTTAYIPQDPEIVAGLNLDWNCPLTAKYDYEQAEACRAAGQQVWSYICLGPRHPYANWLADDPLVEARVIWWQAYHQQMDGFLYWGLNIWGRRNNDHIIDPEQAGPKLKWSITTGGTYDTLHGDGELLYPGKDGPFGCIRLDNIRDGIEDYEYLWLLAELEGDRERGREACLPVTSSLTDFTRDPGQVRAQREKVARRIEALKGR